MKVLAVFSGGMDSATAVACALSVGHEVATVSFDYGSKHNDMEWYYAKKFCDHYKITNRRIHLDFVAAAFKSDLLKSGGDIPEGHYADESMKSTVVPFRNGIMLAIATGLAESDGMDAIMIGNHSGDHAIYPDCREEFIDGMSVAMFTGTYRKIQLISPFVKNDKAYIVKAGHKVGVPYHLTYSCYKGQAKHCGKCGTCVERQEAFHLAGVTDPTEYEQ